VFVQPIFSVVFWVLGVRGGVAQLVERPLCTRKASGSNPLISTSLLICGMFGRNMLLCV
jgi:hypothetical protein